MRSLKNDLRFLAAVQLLPALESGEETLVGGQAVLEGVMMRSPHAWSIACRKPSGEVVTMSEPLERPSEKHKWMAWPIVRGVMTLGYAMTLGYRALRFSANVAIEDFMHTEAPTADHVGTAASAVQSGQSPEATPESATRKKAASISGWWVLGVLVPFGPVFFRLSYPEEARRSVHFRYATIACFGSAPPEICADKSTRRNGLVE